MYYFPLYHSAIDQLLYKLNDDTYVQRWVKVREYLVQIGLLASDWLKYFLKKIRILIINIRQMLHIDWLSIYTMLLKLLKLGVEEGWQRKSRLRLHIIRVLNEPEDRSLIYRYIENADRIVCDNVMRCNFFPFSFFIFFQVSVELVLTQHLPKPFPTVFKFPWEIPLKQMLLILHFFIMSKF